MDNDLRDLQAIVVKYELDALDVYGTDKAARDARGVGDDELDFDDSQACDCCTKVEDPDPVCRWWYRRVVRFDRDTWSFVARLPPVTLPWAGGTVTHGPDRDRAIGKARAIVAKHWCEDAFDALAVYGDVAVAGLYEYVGDDAHGAASPDEGGGLAGYHSEGRAAWPWRRVFATKDEGATWFDVAPSRHNGWAE